MQVERAVAAAEHDLARSFGIIEGKTPPTTGWHFEGGDWRGAYGYDYNLRQHETVVGWRFDLSSSRRTQRAEGPVKIPSLNEWPEGSAVAGYLDLSSATSPDGAWHVLAAPSGDLALADQSTKKTRALTQDATHDLKYGDGVLVSWSGQVTIKRAGIKVPPSVLWAPDSSRFVTFIVDATDVRETFLTDFAAGSGNEVHSVRAAYAQDYNIATVSFIIFDAKTGEKTEIDIPPTVVAEDPIRSNFLKWSSKGDALYIRTSSRGGRSLGLWRVDVETGKASQIITEDHDRLVAPVYRFDAGYFLLPDDAGVLWWSQKNGFGQLYLHPLDDGSARNITGGELLISEIVHVSGTAVYALAGNVPGKSPYHRQLYRLDMSGKAAVQLTDFNADVAADASPSGEYFQLTLSRIDQPSEALIIDKDGTIKAVLAAPKFVSKAGVPEAISAFGRDGQTLVYGIMVKPSSFDPAQTYPIVQYIYGGPHTTWAPRGFEEFNTAYARALAETGRIVVIIDGFGTPGRGRSFAEKSHGAGFADCGLPDSIAVIRQLAQTRPYMDLSSIGITGISAGGYCAFRALADHGDVFKIAVSGAGSHDLKRVGAAWGELFVGFGPDYADLYADLSNVNAADRINGSLLLIHGTLDDDTPIANTLLVADALQKAGKAFDLLILPKVNHALWADKAYYLNTWRYFIKHQAHQERTHPANMSSNGVADHD